ncbi:helix-turn-helix domain-containing protein [Enterococcus dongliensis]|uniref:helix-turn-helix domain-containing protein n=1 Tax=Enterococcus dongliensis TaxID=2559925 RepID=UPI0028903748|nr:helix-turn-helix domain-containing protein [Enterococcus dongliensis]MDT2604746.1 helix-turn-helix domain-containing protein [Enterococcus dongliensis]MDT2646165.1 helix-turn-helix domain-containing protein [Enterococcus dongliensis]MDT2672503.1 helix-turn-helix domain-containing protein [Enterococcus dongliensis]MDT2712325.1 helix-turn-helix domain-containing protein [Enterococcus dongliensis]
MQLLLLTKVPLYEENFERQLKQLGNEVYCSTNVLTALKRGMIDKNFLNQFEGIIFSETLYDSEIQEIMKQLSQETIKCFRRASESKHEEADFLPFDSWIPLDIDLCRLREILLIAELSHMVNKGAAHVQQVAVKQKLSELSLKLKQKEIVYYLIQAGDRTVPREEISQQIWEKAPTKSVLASLSKVVSKVNEKLENEFGDEAIQTIWGQGYRLNKKFFDYLENDLVDVQETVLCESVQQ